MRRPMLNNSSPGQAVYEPFCGSGTSIIASYVGNVLTLSGTDSVANYQTVLRTITYDNLSANPNTTARVITASVSPYPYAVTRLTPSRRRRLPYPET